MAEKIKKFFYEAERIFDAFPGYVKVFIYSTLSTLIGAYAAGEIITLKFVLLTVAFNIGLYSGVKKVNNMRLMEKQ